MFFDLVRLTDFDEAKQEFNVPGLDFFASNLREQLFNYLDGDITEIILTNIINDQL